MIAKEVLSPNSEIPALDFHFNYNTGHLVATLSVMLLRSRQSLGNCQTKTVTGKDIWKNHNN